MLRDSSPGCSSFTLEATGATASPPRRRPAEDRIPALGRAERTTQLLARAAQADAAERAALHEQVVCLNMPLARDLASRYRGRGLALEDLQQVAYLGLVKAVSRFDPHRGTEFLSFAYPTILGELKRHFRDAGWAVRPPRRIQELQTRIWAADAMLFQRLGHSPRPADVAAELGVDEEHVIEALAYDGCFRPASLNAASHRGSTTSLGDTLGYSEAGYDLAELRVVLGDALRTLSERDRLIVERRFIRGWSQDAIGRELGVTQMQVSRLLARITRDLRAAIPDSSA